jgi:enolase
MSHSIKAIHAHEILDSRGNPTLEVSVLLANGVVGSASVPSGASTGVHEALELRDDDKKRYGGKGVLKAVGNVKKIEKEVIGMPVTRQSEIDKAMIVLDGTKNKSKLGANAILGVSLACAHAAARHKRLPLYAYMRDAFQISTSNFQLPFPMMNIMNGGAHAGWALDFQEFMIVPRQKLMRERVRCGAEIFHELGLILKSKSLSSLVGDEGGYSAKLKSNQGVFVLLNAAVKNADYSLGTDVQYAIDVAASELYDSKIDKYNLKVDGKSYGRDELTKYYLSLIKKYPVVSIEDPLEQDDWGGWANATNKLEGAMIVGDDFFVTNTERLQKGIELGAANAILIKPNQIGTLSETMDAITLAQSRNYKVIISHRSGETCDTTIADLAVAVNADYIKTGSLSRGERVAKYNRLMEIEEEIVCRN